MTKNPNVKHKHVSGKIELVQITQFIIEKLNKIEYFVSQ